MRYQIMLEYQYIQMICKSKIENYILRHIYKYVYPTMQIEGDKNFYKDTRKLEWIKPENLEIKKLYVNQLKFAEKYIKRLDKPKSVNWRFNLLV